MPHKKRSKKNHLLVKKILANSEHSLIDRKKNVKSNERVPRRENRSKDRKREEQILNDDVEDEIVNRKKLLKKHIDQQLKENDEKKNVIPKKSRRNKYFLKNHPELKDLLVEMPKKRRRSIENEDEPIVSTKKLAKEIVVNEPVKSTSICDKLLSHMVTSRFRYLNEKLYTSTSQQAKELFKKDPQSFFAYHQGYSASMSRWPDQPIDEIINYVRKRASNVVVADLGCGDARLARTLKSTHPNIRSFDLVALNDDVEICDIAKTPLKDASVDIVVFCLSLMGTNLTDFIREAHRILRLRGTMKIIEIASRFENQPKKFIQKIEKIGFHCSKTDALDEEKNTPTSKYFFSFDFVKTSEEIQSKPIVSLAPCLHKKR